MLISTKKKIKKWGRKLELQFIENLSDLLENGYELSQCLRIITSTIPQLTNDIAIVQTKLEKGERLANALTGFIRQHILDEMNLSELHGCQIDLLRVIANRERQYQSQLKRLVSLMCYPLCILMLMFVVGTYLMLVMVPQKGQLMLTEQTILGIMLVIGLLIFGVVMLKKVPKLKRLYLLTHIPVLGHIMRLNLEQSICFHIGYLLRSGVSLVVVSKFCQQHPQYWLCQLVGKSVSDNWQEGKSLLEGLNQVSYMSDEAKALFLRGSTSKKVGDDLIKVANQLTPRIDQRIQIVLAYVQPLLFLVIGLLVILLYMMLLMPLYDQMLEIGEMI